MRFAEDEFGALLDEKYGKPYTYPTLALLYPWLDFQHHFHQDHIHPRSRFTKPQLARHGITAPADVEWFKDRADRIPNLQLLQGIPNQEKWAKPFQEWIEQAYPDEAGRQAYMERHLIPDVELSFANFREFYEKRRQLMLTELKRIVGREDEHWPEES